jgi:hypothetical protein
MPVLVDSLAIEFTNINRKDRDLQYKAQLLDEYPAELIWGRGGRICP